MLGVELSLNYMISEMLSSKQKRRIVEEYVMKIVKELEENSEIIWLNYLAFAKECFTAGGKYKAIEGKWFQ